MLIKTTLIAFLGAILCLDRTCLQMMVSRPVVTAPVIGLILGDVKTGLVVGAFLELLWVDRPALGNYIPPNDSIMAVVITGATILTGTQIGDVSRPLTAFALLVLLPFSYITQKIDTYTIATNDALANAALEDAKKGDIAAIERWHLLALLKTYLVTLVVIFLFTAIGTILLSHLFPRLSAAVQNALNLVYFAFPVVMISVALNTIKLRSDILVFCAIFVAAVIFCEIFYGL